jgi:hypothetical protein
MTRAPAIHHCTSEPYRFFGREAELAALDEALRGGAISVAALVGPGGQGKTAIVQHWLRHHTTNAEAIAGVFFWSFYRGKDSDLCLRELYAYAHDLEQTPELNASYCVDHLVPLLRQERWALVLDGAEVVQYESGEWFGRFVHPELGRLLEELASAPMPGVVVLTSRFAPPTLSLRRHARLLTLSALDANSARGLLRSLGVRGDDAALDVAARACGFHAKAVELLGTLLVHRHDGAAAGANRLPELPPLPGASDEERHVARVLTAFHQALRPEVQDIVALATAFRQPLTEAQLLDYLTSAPLAAVLHGTWGRAYEPFAQRRDWLARQVDELVKLRLLERVGGGLDFRNPVFCRNRVSDRPANMVIDAHPLVRRGFEGVMGAEGRRAGAQTRAGFLRGRPDRRPPDTLEQAREEIELFHAYCDAGLWSEADNVYVALDNPKHRFLAPAVDRDLLLRFFPQGDWRRPPLWPGFGRYRSLAICFELLGQFEDAVSAYREADAPLRGDALIALGRLEPLLAQPQAPCPWQTLWQAYRAHALCLAGQVADAVALARAIVPVDVYEWVHVFECLLRARNLDALDLRSVLYRPPHAVEHRWSALARQRMRIDYLRITEPKRPLGDEYREVIEAYDKAGMPYERTLTRLGFVRWLSANGRGAEADGVRTHIVEIAQRYGMPLIARDAQEDRRP